jgi:hypothetical protein
MRAELLSLSLSPEKVIAQMFFVVVSTAYISIFSSITPCKHLYTINKSEEMIALNQHTHTHRKSIPFFFMHVVLLFSRQEKKNR